jgi:16S rRNA A1518/A1519 N6-dimethyltransferase RsmA/KsgA/DIM1 with predicted DNA glycosylase/AP lyase activity
MFLYIFIALTILSLIALFSSPKLSPVPYFPTNKKDIPLIIKALNLKNNQTIVDLGAGDGLVIFAAAQKSLQKNFNTQFVAIEINPVLVLVLLLRQFFHPNKNNIKIIWGDFFKITTKQSNNVTIYLYVSPWLIDKIIENWKLKIKNFSVVSYMYPVKSLRAKEKIIKGKNKIFIY